MSDLPTASILLSPNCRLMFSFVFVDEDFVVFDAVLKAERSTLAWTFEVAPSHFADFIGQLSAMHRDLKGEAVLLQRFGGWGLRFEMVRPATGSIRVSGKLEVELGGIGNAMRVQFDELWTDQSFVPEFVRQLETFPTRAANGD